MGPYQNTVRDVAFSRINVPKVIDALLIRLKLHRDDGDVFAYRAPKPDRQEALMATGDFDLIPVPLNYSFSRRRLVLT